MANAQVGMLMRVWVKPDAALIPLRDDGLALLARTPTDQHPAIQWGMLLATYAFFNAIAESTGRLLALQGDVMLAHVPRRAYEQFGAPASASSTAWLTGTC